MPYMTALCHYICSDPYCASNCAIKKLIICQRHLYNVSDLWSWRTPRLSHKTTSRWQQITYSHCDTMKTTEQFHLVFYSCPRYICHIFIEYIHIKKLNYWHFNKGSPTGLRQFAKKKTRFEPPSPCDTQWSTLSYSHPVWSAVFVRWLAVTVATRCWCFFQKWTFEYMKLAKVI